MNNTVRREHQDKLGEDFGGVYHGLWNDWAWGLMRIQEFRELFSNASHVELLNAITGGEFLWDVQHILWDDLMLRRDEADRSRPHRRQGQSYSPEIARLLRGSGAARRSKEPGRCCR